MNALPREPVAVPPVDAAASITVPDACCQAAPAGRFRSRCARNVFATVEDDQERKICGFGFLESRRRVDPKIASVSEFLARERGLLDRAFGDGGVHGDPFFRRGRRSFKIGQLTSAENGGAEGTRVERIGVKGVDVRFCQSVTLSNGVMSSLTESS